MGLSQRIAKLKLTPVDATGPAIAQRRFRALVLSGGGVKGAYEVGALRHFIVDQGLEYDLLCGVSVGAINTGFLAQYPRGKLKQGYEELVKMWGRVNNAQVRTSWTGGPLAALWKPSVYDSSPLQAWLRRDIKPANIQSSGRMLRVGAVSLSSGRYALGTEKDANIVDWIIASASFPVFLLPIQIGQEVYSDGGIRNVTPIGAAIDLGATDIDVVMCSNPDLPSNWNASGRRAIPDTALRVVDLMSDEIIRTDLDVTLLKNDLAEQGIAGYRSVRVRLVKPDSGLVSDSLDFDQAAIQGMIARGYEDARKACP